MSIESALQELTHDPRFAGSIMHRAGTPEHPALLAPLPQDLDPRLAAALDASGISSLYTHQALAVNAALHNEHVAVVTPAASGKTLCYNLPVLHRLLQDTDARALFISFRRRPWLRINLPSCAGWRTRWGKSKHWHPGCMTATPR